MDPEVPSDYSGVFISGPLRIPAPSAVLRGEVFMFTHDLVISGPQHINLTLNGQTRTVPAVCEPGLCTVTDPATVAWIRTEFWDKDNEAHP